MNFKNLERYLRVNFFGTGPSSYKKIIYWAAVSQRLRSTALNTLLYLCGSQSDCIFIYLFCLSLHLVFSFVR